jgi:predicted DNA-binding protein
MITIYSGNNKMADQLIVRINPELKNKAPRLARTEGKNLSEIIRELLESYVKDRDIGSYIDNLWNKIGDELIEAGSTTDDIDLKIQEVRKK